MFQRASKVHHEKQNLCQQLEANTSTKNMLRNLLLEARVLFFFLKKAQKYNQHIALNNTYKANNICATMNTFPKANKPENS